MAELFADVSEPEMDRYQDDFVLRFMCKAEVHVVHVVYGCHAFVQ